MIIFVSRCKFHVCYQRSVIHCFDMNALNIDLNDPDTMAFDERPDDFVEPNSDPIVFTIRGLRHFKPRFEAIGVELARIKTRAEFDAAYHEWTKLEAVLLADRVATRAQATNRPNEYQLLHAALTGSDADIEQARRRLAHQSIAQLKAVP